MPFLTCEPVCVHAEATVFSTNCFSVEVVQPFDLLNLNGRDVRQLPLIERKKKLRTLIEQSALPDVVCGNFVEGAASSY
jgi:hypothetical protein